MKNDNMAKAGGNKGSNSVSPKAGIHFTQNRPPHTPEVKRLSSVESLNKDVPGDGNVAKACGAVREGSARRYANAMDMLVGSASEPVREASSGDNE